MKKSRSKTAPARMRLIETTDVRTKGAVEGQAAAVQALAAAVLHNAIKRKEFGRDNAVAPPAGQNIEPSTELASASTVSETNSSAKTGSRPTRDNANGIGALDRVRVDGGGQGLTTNQGVAVSDNQNSLKAGLRGPTLLARAGVSATLPSGEGDPGLLLASVDEDVAAAFIAAVGKHRHPERATKSLRA